MLSLVGKNTDSFARFEAIHAEVSGFLYDAFSSEDGLLGDVDRWTQRRVTMENLAKVDLVLSADDPVEHCYQNLIREIDTEAETGIYRVRKDAADPILRDLANESGVSGELYREVAEIAPKLFADELRHSDDQLDIVWVTINARYDRARADAEISRIVLGPLLDDADVAADMANAVRTLMYALHEDVTRRQCDLPLLLDGRETRDLVLMVSELERRAGSYVERVREIERKAGTL
jgi:hypothetical protein